MCEAACGLFLLGRIGDTSRETKGLQGNKKNRPVPFNVCATYFGYGDLLMEKPPEKSRGDAAHAVTKAIVGLVPVAGSALPVLLETIFAPPLERRREKWLQKLSEALTDLECRMEGFSLDNLSNNELFITAVAQATQVALRTHQAEKLNALKQAVIHSALPGSPDEDQQLIFLRFIEELTPSHLKLLAFLNKPLQWIERNNIEIPTLLGRSSKMILDLCFPEFKKEQEFLEQVNKDLKERGLVQQSYVIITKELSPRITEFGKRFLVFISEEEQ
jgi:hypothetical protein